MNRKDDQPGKTSSLRRRERARPKKQRAEDKSSLPAGRSGKTADGPERIIHELEARQSELTRQNEELRQIWAETEAALARYADLFEFAPVGYFTLNPDGRIVEANLMGARMLQVNRSSLLNQPFSRYVAHESKGLIRSYVQDVIQSREKRICELQARRSDGSTFFVSAESMGVWDQKDRLLKFLIVIVDISERKRMEEELRRSEKRYRHIVEDHASFICRHRGDGTITFVNEAICELMGKAKEEIQGSSLYDYIPIEDHPVVREAIASLSKECPDSRQLHRVALPNGRIVWHEWISRMVFNPRGQFVEYQAAGRDITEIQKAQEALREAKENLERRVRQRTKALAKVNEDLVKREQELEEESRRLQDANTALKILLHHREEDRRNLEESVLTNVRKLVLPHLETLLRSRLSPVQSNLVNIIETNLKDLVSPFLRTLMGHYANLTPREIDVVHLAREGKTAKEIAEILNSSVRSIEFHKANIRTKLGLKNRKVNLRSHLLSLKP
ncbi:MAG: PAS domain S-box protein [Syntrophaceae bacterium]|nr:PAS domain S-box protein [Syntrophaceae bacterium]